MISDVEFRSHANDDPQGAARLVTTAQALSAALMQHASAIVAAGRDPEKLVAADEALLPLLADASEAYQAYTGEEHPMHAFEEEQGGCGGDCACAAGAEEEAGDEEAATQLVVSVLQRHDYAITSPEALVEAGRAAFLKTSPDSTEADAAAEVVDLDMALLHLAHTDGWNELWQLEGLEAVGGVTAVIPQSDPLAGDADAWPEEFLGDVLAEDDEPLFVQVDVYED